MQYTINFDMKGQFRLEKDLNSKEKHIIISLSENTVNQKIHILHFNLEPSICYFITTEIKCKES